MRADFSGVYAILDTQVLHGRDPAILAAAAARGGATTLQLRAKSASTRDFVDLARRTLAGLVGTGVPLLINDRIDVALAVGAHGVHIGRDDMEPSVVRRLLGPSAIIGVTLKTSSDVSALGGDVDYGCIGGVFPTRYKDNPDAPIGIDGFAAVHAEARRLFPSMPTGAIAGITAANAGELAAAGADFIAVVGAVFGGTDVKRAARDLTTAFQRGRAT